ncbi:MAG TPA: MFS transporter [Bryobacteraceae bacterium]|jgi:MFS family permease
MTSSPNYRWHVVGMLWAISFFNYADRQAIFSVFPLLEKTLHLSTTQLGLLGSSFALVYGICSQFAGLVVDRVRRKTAILGGLSVWSVICMATGFFSNFRALLVLRAAEGLGETFYYPASMSLISDYHGKDTRSRAIGFHQTSVYIGTIAGGFFAGLIGQYYGWRWSFFVFGGLGLILGLVLKRLLKEPARGAADAMEIRPPEAVKSLSTGDSLRLVWSSRTAVTLMAAFACSNFVAAVLYSWMPKFVYDRFHMNLALSGLTATVFVQLASMAGSITGGWLADRLRARRPGGRMLVQAIGVFGGAPFVALCGLTQSILWLIVALTVWGFFKGLYDANIFASVFDVIRPEARGTAAGYMNTVGWLGGGATAPLLIGLIARNHGLGFGIALASVVYLAAGLLLLLASLVFAPCDVERMRDPNASDRDRSYDLSDAAG